MIRFFLPFLFCSLFACRKTTPGVKTRPFRMGFGNSAPRFDDTALFNQSLALWTSRADASIVSTEVPWAALLGGEPVNTYVQENYAGLVAFYRSKHLPIWVYVDPANGLDRGAEATALTAASRSITEPAIQQIYQQFVLAMDSMLHPEHIGLALETNLIRSASSASLYAAVKNCSMSAATALRDRKSAAKLSVSVQVDQAWGKLTNSDFIGIDQDVQDFPFVEELGLSCYPYFVFAHPSDVPQDYFTRVVGNTHLPVFISEGGWASLSFQSAGGSFVTSEQDQLDYIDKEANLLTSVHGTAWFQLTFTDLDTTALPAGLPASIHLFTSLGLVDDHLQPKPALSAWDSWFSKPLH